MVRTVLGDVEAVDIGPALLHEHVLFDIVPPGASGDRHAEIRPEDRWQIDYRSNEAPANAHQRDVGIAAHELALYASDGGSLIVDQSVAGLARDAHGLARASRASGVHVVAAAGTYTAPFLDKPTVALDEAALAVRFASEIETGLDGTTIRAGIIGEIGCSWPLEPVERRALVAAARAQRQTGAAVSIHPGRHEDACVQILDILEAAGGDLSRTVLCHMDRTHPSGHGIPRLLERGACVEWDFFGIEQSHYWMGETELPTDLGRLRLILDLAEHGWGARIAVSHDICTRTRLRTWGGHGYGHILRNVTALMRRLGFTAELIENLTRRNPLRLLTLEPA